VLAARAEGWQVRGSDVAPLPRIRIPRPEGEERPPVEVDRDPRDEIIRGPEGLTRAPDDVVRGPDGNPRETEGLTRDTGGITLNRAGTRYATEGLSLAARAGFSTNTPEVGADELERAAQAILDFSGEEPEGEARATAAALGHAVDILFAAPPRITRGSRC